MSSKMEMWFTFSLMCNNDYKILKLQNIEFKHHKGTSKNSLITLITSSESLLIKKS